jgi:hypothetical protein
MQIHHVNCTSTDDDREGPLTWAQQEMLYLIKRTAETEQHAFNMQEVTPVPKGRAVDDILDTVASLTARHVSLRATYDVDSPAGPTQRIYRARRLDVAVLSRAELGLRPDQQVSGLGAVPAATCPVVCRDKSFATEPVRIAVVTNDDQPDHLVVCLSHLVTDGAGLAAMHSDLRELLETGRLGGDDPAFVHPLDVAAVEISATGRQRDEHARRYWRECLASTAAANPEAPVNKEAGRTFPRLRMHSAALMMAVPMVAERYRVSPSIALFTAIAYCVAARTDRSALLCSIPFANRLSDTAHAGLGAYAQHAIAVWDVSERTFGGSATGVLRATMTAYRHAKYDPVSLHRTFGRWPGFDDLAYFDFMINSAMLPNLPADDGRSLSSLVADTAFITEPRAPESGRFWFWVSNEETYCRVTFGSRPEFLRDEEMRRMLLDIEGLCVAQARNEPFSLPRVGAIH